MKRKYSIKVKSTGTEIRIIDTNTQAVVNECDGLEEGLNTVECLLSLAESSCEEYHNLRDLLQDILKWYTTKHPFFLDENLPSQEILDKIERMLIRGRQLHQAITHKVIWYGRKEIRPFVLHYELYGEYIFFMNEDHFEVFSDVSHLRRYVTQIARDECWPPDILAKIFKDIEDGNSEDTKGIGGINLKLKDFRKN